MKRMVFGTILFLFIDAKVGGYRLAFFRRLKDYCPPHERLPILPQRAWMRRGGGIMYRFPGFHPGLFMV